MQIKNNTVLHHCSRNHNAGCANDNNYRTGTMPFLLPAKDAHRGYHRAACARVPPHHPGYSNPTPFAKYIATELQVVEWSNYRGAPATAKGSVMRLLLQGARSSRSTRATALAQRVRRRMPWTGVAWLHHKHCHYGRCMHRPRPPSTQPSMHHEAESQTKPLCNKYKAMLHKRLS